MYCYQCQEAAQGVACTRMGVCGKNDEVAGLQDVLIYTAKGIALAAEQAAAKGVDIAEADRFIVDSLFATITNANFDPDNIAGRILRGLAIRDSLLDRLGDAAGDLTGSDALTWRGSTAADFAVKALEVGVLATAHEDIRSIRELLVYGLKGMAAYYHHAAVLGYEDESIPAFMRRALASTIDESLGVNDLVELVMACGGKGVETMALLDKANTETYGAPEPTMVDLGVRSNPGILVSGHDLRDLAELLEQTRGTGVDIYTHGEMLPAQSYPAFKKYGHFAGNYGGSWWAQKKEFEAFNGPILMTTNCLVPPRDSYRDRVYTVGVVGHPGCPRLPEREEGRQRDFSTIIEHAKRSAPPEQLETGAIPGGFAHAAVLGLADKVVEAVKSGAIRRFFVMAGCDGRMKSRSYYTEFAAALPKDTVILTAGCAKYRYNKLDLGDIGGIPRVLDAGQCNDSYSLVVIAKALAEAFGLDDINDLPVSYNIAWYEQKAVIVLLALLSLGVKNIHLGPSLPTFLSPNVADVLVKNFGIAGIGGVDADVELFLNA